MMLVASYPDFSEFPGGYAVGEWVLTAPCLATLQSLEEKTGVVIACLSPYACVVASPRARNWSHSVFVLAVRLQSRFRVKCHGHRNCIHCWRVTRLGLNSSYYCPRKGLAGFSGEGLPCLEIELSYPLFWRGGFLSEVDSGRIFRVGAGFGA